MRKTLDPKNDVVFKILFAAPAHQPILIALLSAVLKPPSPIREAKVLNPEIPRVLPSDRAVVLDVRVLLDDGRHVDVEMQLEVRKGVSERFLYYWAKVYGGQLEPSDPYTDLDPCISVLFLGEKLLPGDRFHSTFRVREIHDHHDLTDRLELHVIELPKLGNAEPNDTLTAWGRFLVADSDEELEALAMTAPEIREAKAALYEISADEKARQLALDRELNEAAHKIYVGAAYHSGKREGRAEGRAEGLRDAIASMAELLGLPINDQRKGSLAAMDASQLQTLAERIRQERKWPE